MPGPSGTFARTFAGMHHLVDAAPGRFVQDLDIPAAAAARQAQRKGLPIPLREVQMRVTIFENRQIFTPIGLTADETAEFGRLDRLSPVDPLGNCLWDFEGDPKTPDEKRCLEFYRKLETALSTWPAAEGRWLHWLVARSQ